MRKKKKKVFSSLFVAGALLATACSSGPKKKTSDGESIVVTLTDSNGNTHEISANELWGDMLNTKLGGETVFNSIEKVVIQAAQPVNDDIKNATDQDYETYIENVKSEASSSGVKYSTLLSQKLEEEGVSTTSELYDKFELANRRDALEKEYVNDNADVLLNTYRENALPYQAKHILVSTGNGGSAYDATISESQALKMINVIKQLTQGDSFEVVAYEQSDDTSAARNGDLGIADANSSYVKEFEMGVYMFEAISAYYTDPNFASNQAEIADRIKLTNTAFKPYDIYSAYSGTELENMKFNYFTSALFTDSSNGLNAYAKQEFTDTGYKIAKESHYPRNLYFNRNINNHKVSLIRLTNTESANLEEGSQRLIMDASIFGESNNVAGGLTEPGLSNSILADGKGNPVFVVSASTGFHIIALERSTFDETFSDYFTTSTVDQNADAYINYNSKDNAERATKLNELKDKLRSSVNPMNVNMFKYLTETRKGENKSVVELKYNDDEVKEVLFKYINSIMNDATINNQFTFEEKWTTYSKSLKMEADIKDPENDFLPDWNIIWTAIQACDPTTYNDKYCVLEE